MSRYIKHNTDSLAQNFIWVPAAIYFGRRPVWLLTCTIAFCFAIWAALAKNLNSLLAARVVVSIAGSNTEALGAIMVNVRRFHLIGH